MEQKYYFISLCYDSFFSYVLLVIFIQVYRISILRREAKLQEETYKQQLVEAELKNLKMKFQPHFIFNSLHSISATAYKNPEIADSMISKLSELLRHSINSSENNFTTVEEEVPTGKKYIEIQKMRFGNRIDYTEQVDQLALKERIPLFVIQPLLENCIKHAVELTDECISIITNVESIGGRLEINITNNLPDGIKESEKSLGEGIQNLRERLNYIYNGEYLLETGITSDKKYSVRISMSLNNE
ncbi:MAG: histidine kinase [Ignavibacteriaceae bacterium]|nr:histidine kinase [Ignavibacteriaceae bacterium]